MESDSILISLPAPRTRRRHSPEFKARVIEACLQPGVSIAAVALANQLNTNFVRKWVKAHRKRAQQEMSAKGELYALEAQARDADAVARLMLRQSEAKPRLRALHDWLIAQRLRTADGSGLARAIDYSLKRWPALIRYADSGDLPIDNNPVENAIRPIALGRRNWLFSGSERAGRRAAAIQSLLATAKLNGLEPYA